MLERFFRTLHEILIGCQLSSSEHQHRPLRSPGQFLTVSCHRLGLARTNNPTFISNGGAPQPWLSLRAPEFLFIWQHIS